jgi:hypothetical protein
LGFVLIWEGTHARMELTPTISHCWRLKSVKISDKYSSQTLTIFNGWDCYSNANRRK